MIVDEQERCKRKLARARERRATLILGIVMASFIGCWLPFFSIYPLSMIFDLDVPDGGLFFERSAGKNVSEIFLFRVNSDVKPSLDLGVILCT